MSQTQAFNTVEEVIRARHSVRKYKKGVTIPEADLNEILELAASAPSSWNLQQWRFLVITEQERKDKLLPVAYGQQQVSDASALIVVLGDLEADKTGQEIYDAALAAGAIPQEVRDNLVNQISSAYKVDGIPFREATLNASLAAMQLMIAAKAKGYDTVAMGGYDKARLAEELQIPARYTSVMLISLGVAEEPGRATGRLPLDKVVFRESI